MSVTLSEPVNASARRTAVVTGASSGIGAACARLLAAAGFHVVIGARRVDRLDDVAAEIERAGNGPVTVLPLDVTDDESVETFCAQIDECDVLVNNAGGAIGLERIEDADLDEWMWMYDVNVLGTLRVTKGLMSKIVDSGDGVIVLINSIASNEIYEGGAGYIAAKHAEKALGRTLRVELLGQPVRVTSVEPGMVETEFSLVRFRGDEERAAKVYDGVEPMTADDVAEVVVFAVTRPPHVNLEVIEMKARAQGSWGRVLRTS